MVKLETEVDIVSLGMVEEVVEGSRAIFFINICYNIIKLATGLDAEVVAMTNTSSTILLSFYCSRKIQQRT